jgi:hypothetical protein
MKENNKLATFGLGMILVTAFALAGTAAYESIIGLSDLFAARKEVVVIMAIFIEFAKLLFAGALHMFWKDFPWWKWIGVGIIGVHMAVTNIGIYSYLSSGYILQEAPVAALERRIDIINGSITSHTTIESEAVERITAMDIAYREYVENLFVKRAEKYKETNSLERAELEAERDAARAEIRKLEVERAKLEEAKVDNAAKLGSIEHISAFVGSNTEDVMKVVAFFTILLMMGLDPAALMMVILFSFLLSKKIRDDQKPTDALPQLDDETRAVVEHLDNIGYLKNRRKGKR